MKKDQNKDDDQLRIDQQLEESLSNPSSPCFTAANTSMEFLLHSSQLTIQLTNYILQFR